MQITLEGKTMDEVAIERIQEHEPPEGYYLCFSGGKDSVCIYDLAIRSGAKFDAHYSVSPIDPPEVRQFIKDNYPDVIWDYHARGFWQKVTKKGLPTRLIRWCCEYIKEGGGRGRVCLLGMRAKESTRRKAYAVKSQFTKQKDTTWILPIVDWSTDDVWLYIEERNLNVCSLYEEGFHRLGCVLCPFGSPKQTQKEMARWPKIALAWRRASDRVFERISQNGGQDRWDTPDDFWTWWIGRK